MEGKFVDTKFGKIRPLEHGSGENTIIFVHGNLASAIWFKEMFKIPSPFAGEGSSVFFPSSVM